MKNYRFLLFDLDNTLLDFNADETMAFEKLYCACGFEREKPYAAAMLELYDSLNSKWWRIFEDGGCTKAELFRNRFADFLADTGFSGDPDRMNETYFRFLGTGGVPFPGALALLEKLSARYELYVITNGNAATAKTRIENSGVGKYVRQYFVSETTGFAKPDKRYFDYVAAHIPGFEKERALVIGDSPISDMQGAIHAGMDSLWFRREGDGWFDGREVPCTYTAHSFQEIEEMLLDACV